MKAEPDPSEPAEGEKSSPAQDAAFLCGDWGTNHDFPRYVGDIWRLFVSQPFRDIKMAFQSKEVTPGPSE